MVEEPDDVYLRWGGAEGRGGGLGEKLVGDLGEAGESAAKWEEGHPGDARLSVTCASLDP